ncbi:MAG: hypothetical protein K2Y18_01275 [Alphaproteobacteria bacterium]|jgi:hypothetical protein|nr:hypothetical protein [Alphaproteobacteria bacterium]
MNKHIAHIFSYTFLLASPLMAMEEPIDVPDSDKISITGLKREHVVQALWVNASGTGNAEIARAYMPTATFPLPTQEEARQFSSKSTGSYFMGRKMPIAFGEDSFGGYGYNMNHGPNRAQKVIEALRILAEKGDVTEAALKKLYVPVLDEVLKIEWAKMNALIAKGEMERTFPMHTNLTAIKDADCVGLTMAMDLNGEQTKGAQEFAKGLAGHYMGRGTNTTQTPAPTPTTTPPPPSTKEDAVSTPPLSNKFEEDMKAGLQGMFGGKSEKKKNIKK